MLTAILGAIDEGIHVVDAQGQTIMYNHIAARLDGLTQEEVLGKPLLEVFPSLDANSSTLLKVIKTGKPLYHQSQRYTNWRGVQVETINTTLPVKVGERLVGAVEVAKDIKKMRELSEQLVDLQVQVQGNRQKPVKSRVSDQVTYQFDDILTVNDEMKRLKRMAMRASQTSSPILIYGETGTGKELLVQSVHQASPRKNRPFIAQNCAALPASLLEGILFGTVKGGFTGAEDRPGLFEVANGGTLFLDEINSMPGELQAKLLRVLQDGQVRRVGGTNPIQVDIRVIAATNEEPEKVLESGALRADLYYRLHVVSFTLPPLRDRREDIPLLTNHFIAKYNRLFELKVRGLHSQVEDWFFTYQWPGNIRELEHMIEAAMNLVEGDRIEQEDLPPSFITRMEGQVERDKMEQDKGIAHVTMTGTLREVLHNTEKNLIMSAMNETNGNVLQAAKRLGIPRQTLQYKLSQLKEE
ncbi:sigma-54 interaction domain-containing protein [Brevibacillus daliensis]|uniref:sigma-54 interaction domain-containing protein n=1 Tax=Brevibacillus daliensis TaxID=2892995 RepID=UPI0027152C75|nr:sigma 54-interacting transcriptional regulator [Brevibacillus daliensis]